jgi:holin-like protein
MDSAPAPSRLRFALQLGLVVLFWLAGEALVRLLHLSVPGGLIGLLLVLVLLSTRTLKVAAVKRGADWLLAQMLVFFVPAVLAVLDHREFFGLVGLKILFVIVMSTIAVMAATALVVEFAMRRGLGGRLSVTHV